MSVGDAIIQGLPRLRAMAESLMRDTVKVERRVGKPDPESGVAPMSQVYAGKAKIQTYEAHDSTPEVIGATVTVQRYHVHVPVGSFAPQEGDVVTVTSAANDPYLAGRTYRVEALLHKTNATAYRLQVSEMLP